MTGLPVAKEPRFITLEEALSLHESAIDAHGGSYGVRDQGLLESALAAPRQGFGGQYAYSFPHEMAAAYLFHLCKNHAFIDGNKRIAWVSAVFFMRVNGWNLLADEQEAIQLVLDVATDKTDKPGIADWINRNSRLLSSVQLREFFARLRLADAIRFGQGFSQGNDIERDATFQEAAAAVHMISELATAIRDVKSQPESDDQLRNKWFLIGSLATLLIVFRQAEDMGYEW